MNISLYSCCHKPGPAVGSGLVVPIHVGAAGSVQRLPMQQDDDGENISQRNPYYCELTATYWIWKHATADVVGLFHYRRMLNLRSQRRKALVPDAGLLAKHGITHERVAAIMEDFDVILPCPNIQQGTNIRELYGRDHPMEDFDTMLDVLAEKYPDMAGTAREVVNRPHRSPGYLANIIICRKPLFDEYASWLFDILFEVERRIHAEVLERDAYQQRAYGFLAERMMNIFIEYKKAGSGLRVCEMPALFLTEDAREWRHYRNKHIKHKLLIALGLGKQKWEENVKSTI